MNIVELPMRSFRGGERAVGTSRGFLHRFPHPSGLKAHLGSVEGGRGGAAEEAAS